MLMKNLAFYILIYLVLIEVSEGEFYCPELYTHQIRDGTNLYAMVFKPHTLQPGKKYPTVLHIYGGPEVQVVSNTFKVRLSVLQKLSGALIFGDIETVFWVIQGMRQLRLHMLAAQGYCVVAIDSRGSRHRGLAFEGHLRCKMVNTSFSFLKTKLCFSF